jgi:NADH-quinone oxidoreductase subunit M
MTIPWLTLLMLLPVAGAVVLALAPLRGPLAKLVALALSVATLALGIGLAVAYDPAGGRQFTEDVSWIKLFGAHYALGIDGIGLTLVLLTVILTPVVMLASWDDAELVGASPKGFFAWMLALEGLSLGVFLATDVFLFYVLFEATLIPVYFLVAGYGPGVDRVRAAVKFLLFSLAGGLVMLASVIGLYVVSARGSGGPTYLLTELGKLDFGTVEGRWMFVGFFIAFAIKAPMFPLHTWLPDTAENASPGTSVLLVSVLDKIGTFGMIRFCLELFPEASRWATPVVVVLAILSILYGAFMAIGSQNIPRLIAYTSISHFGFIVLGVFVMNSQGLSGANLYMFNHGLSTAALFLVTGFLITRRGSALIDDFGGVEKVAPVLAGLFLVAGLSSVSLPGLSPFVSELMVMVGAFVHSPWAAAFAVPAIVLAAIYILWMYQRTMTGPVREGVVGMRDLNTREVASLAPLLLLIVVLGFFPKPLLAVINPAVEHTMSEVGKQDPGPTVQGEGKAGR